MLTNVAKVLAAGRQHTSQHLSFWHSFKNRLIKQKKETGSMCRDNTHGGAQMSLSGFRAAALKKVVLSMCNAFLSNRHEQQLLTKVILKNKQKKITQVLL